MNKHEEDLDKPHPFEKRGQQLKDTLYLLTSQGPTSWDAIFIAGRAIGMADSTMRRAVQEGVGLGVFIKTGGRAGRKYGRPTGPPMVELTDAGRRWFEIKQAEAAGYLPDPDEDDEVEFCEHDHILFLCEECKP
jgi:hypothetical protein